MSIRYTLAIFASFSFFPNPTLPALFAQTTASKTCSSSPFPRLLLLQSDTDMPYAPKNGKARMAEMGYNQKQRRKPILLL